MNTFCHLPDDIIEINGEKFDLELFLEVEPEYSLPEGMVGRKYDENKHILHSSDSSFVGELPWEDGERYVTRSPDLKLLIDTIEEDNKFVDSLRDVSQLTKEGEYPRIHELVIALWEHLVEGKPKKDTINIVQEKRLKVKEKYSK
jgi:hypothetical protein|tara:strand:+ start:173 stop:607 length:435 start_codon:yes stop_codon:yes gene_type:complete